MAIAKLSIDLEAKLATLEANLRGAVDASGKAAQQITQRFDAAGATLKSALAGAVGALSVGMFAQMVRSSVDAIDALNDVADATGTTVENASALEDIARRTGTSVDTATAALVKLNQGLSDPNPDSAASQALRRIGLDAAELRKLDPAEALLKVAQAQARFADDGDKARIIQELFGKSVREVAPFLNDLADKGQLNATATAEQAKQAEEFNKQLYALQANVDAAKRSIIGDLIPAINDLLEAGRKGANGSFLSWIFGATPQQRLNASATAISADIVRTTDAIERMQTELQRDPGNTMLEGRIDKARQRLVGLQAQAQETTSQLKMLAGMNDGGADGLRAGAPSASADTRPGVGPGATDKNKDIKPKITDYERYVQQLEQARDRLQGLTATEQAVYDVATGKLGKLTQAQKERVFAIAQEIDAQRAAEEAQKAITKASDDAARSQQRLRDEAEGLFHAVQTPAERYSAELARIAELSKAGAFGNLNDAAVVERIARIQEAATKRLIDSTSTAKDELSEYAKQAQRNIQDALGDTLTSALKGNFDDIGQMWLDLVQRMAAQALAADLNNMLFQGGSFGGTNIGQVVGAIGSLFGGGGGHPTGGSQEGWDELLGGISGGRATGGDVAAGRAYWVGEQGPEIAVFGRNGTVLPNSATRQVFGGAAPAVTINLAVGEFVTPSQAANLARQTRDAAIAGTMDALRRTGRA